MCIRDRRNTFLLSSRPTLSLIKSIDTQWQLGDSCHFYRGVPWMIRPIKRPSLSLTSICSARCTAMMQIKMNNKLRITQLRHIRAHSLNMKSDTLHTRHIWITNAVCHHCIPFCAYAHSSHEDAAKYAHVNTLLIFANNLNIPNDHAITGWSSHLFPW